VNITKEACLKHFARTRGFTNSSTLQKYSSKF